MILDVYGSGNDQQEKAARNLVKELNITHKVCFHGNCPNEEVQRAMKASQVFLFTSISEDTSTVVMEAISNELPVVCFDICGMSYVIDETVGIKIKIAEPKKDIEDFAQALLSLYSNREKLKLLAENCRKKAVALSWENKAKQMLKLYEKLLEEKSQ